MRDMNPTIGDSEVFSKFEVPGLNENGGELSDLCMEACVDDRSLKLRTRCSCWLPLFN